MMTRATVKKRSEGPLRTVKSATPQRRRERIQHGALPSKQHLRRCSPGYKLHETQAFCDLVTAVVSVDWHECPLCCWWFSMAGYGCPGCPADTVARMENDDVGVLLRCWKGAEDEPVMSSPSYFRTTSASRRCAKAGYTSWPSARSPSRDCSHVQTWPPIPERPMVPETMMVTGRPFP